jgi:hypothetical protein
MDRKTSLLVALVIGACLAVLGCSEDVTEPAPSTAQTTSAVEETEVVDAALGRFADIGIDIENSRGVFSIGWREITRPDEDPSIRGGAMAIGFGEDGPDMPPYVHASVDMGTVTINAPDGPIELNKIEGKRGGDIYTTRARPRENSINVPFQGGADYEFDVSGSAAFSAVAFSVTAPPALIGITSHARGDEVSSEEDLVIEWEGGSDGEIQIVIAAVKAPTDRPDGDNWPGRRGGPGGCEKHGRPGRPGGRPPFDRDDALIETLDSNTGEYVLTAAQLQELIADKDADVLLIHIGQHTVTTVEHDGGELYTLLRNGDRVGMKLQ